MYPQDRKRLGAARRRRAFDLDAYMASQPSGLYLDFAELDRHFVEGSGPTLAGSIGNAIGLALDQREWGGRSLAQVLAEAGPDLLAPGSWTTGSSGGAATAVESPAGAITLTGDGTNTAYAEQVITTVIGATYAVSVTAAGAGAGVIAGTTPNATNQMSYVAPVGSVVGYFQATATTTYLRVRRTTAGAAVLTGLSCKRIALGATIVQNNATFRPLRNATGAAYDGADDHHLSNYLASAGANFILALVDVPGVIPTVSRVIAGAFDAGPVNRIQLGVTFNTGAFCAGIGTQSTSDIVGTTDLRGTTAVLGVSCSGSQVRGFVNEDIEYEAAQSGTPTTTTPLIIGASAANNARWPGTIRKLLVGTEHLTLSRYLQLRASLLG